ncbi:hypothetical protein SDC9_79318 [bioreactor metagenome]|uniref:Uncharacterized protein n=1 Tax=bioreactor metagenome TaxID=1076179 RepID=A0A644Z1Z8_9ZZZZ
MPELLAVVSSGHFAGFIIVPIAAAHHIHAVGLINLPGIQAIASAGIGVFNPFHGQIQAPILSVDGDINEAAQGRIRVKPVHHLITDIIF